MAHFSEDTRRKVQQTDLLERKGIVHSVAVLTITVTCFLWLLARPSLARAESTITCSVGQYDMLDWMTLDDDLRATYHLEGTSNPLYTVMWPDKFWWLKTGNGYPWDIQLFDNNYIYLWITELSWTVPQSYKKFTFNTNLPLVPRCATGGFPGSTIDVPNTSYDLHTNCDQGCSVTLGLQTARNEVWGPYHYTFGGDLPNALPTLVIRYQYNCDVNYQNCGDREEYYVTQRYGLVQWIHYVLLQGQQDYQQVGMTVFNKLVPGIVDPNFPCF